MISLGIESTAHTFAIGIVKKDVDKIEILADARSIFVPEPGSGIHPYLAAQHHDNVKENILQKALQEANLSLDDIDIIGYSAGPGLPPCLKVGYEFSLQLSQKYKKKLVHVNHAMAHLEIAKMMCEAVNPVFLYVSGGNTQIISMSSNCYRIFGETLDISIGNCLDTFARSIGLPFPGGPEVQKLAEKGEKYIQLPYSVKGMDLSFSGLLTEATKKVEKFSKEDVSYSLQETAFSMLVEVCERALAHTEKKELVVTGGVAASFRLTQMLELMCKERGAVFKKCPMKYAGDNRVNIAYAAFDSKDLGFDFNPKWRIDQKLN